MSHRPPQVQIDAGDHLMIDLGRGQFARFDHRDAAVVMHLRWHADQLSGRIFYARTGRPPISMHALIMTPKPGYEVDHVNHDGLDNRRRNLRVCRHRSNACNQRKGTRSPTKYKGVHAYWYAKGEKWKAVISDKGKRHYLGTFDTATAAAMAYDTAAKKLHGKYACLNFPNPTTTQTASISASIGKEEVHRAF